MKIMHIIDSGGFYGAEVMLLNLMAGQKKCGLHPLLCSLGTVGQGEKEIEKQARLYGLDVITIRFRAGLNPVGIYRILRAAHTRHINIIHTHGYKGNILAGIVPRFIRKIPMVSTLHGWTNTHAGSKLALYEWLDKRLLKYRDAVVVVNKLMLLNPSVKTAIIKPDKLHIVNNGIESVPPRIHLSELPAHMRIKKFIGDSFVVGAIGRLSSEKGYAFLLQAIASLHRAGYDVKLVLAGDGPLKNELQEQTARLGIDTIVLFTGYLANASHYLRCFSVLAISSLSEGLPITLLEAMREGVPVVSTRVGGIPDVIEDGVSGKLVNPADTDSLARAIRQLADNPQICESMSNRASSRFRENFTSDRMAVEYLGIYNKLVPL